LQESAVNPPSSPGENAVALKSDSPEDSFVPGRPPDPSITRVGASNVCPGCQSDRIRTLCRGEDFLYRTTERLFLVVECKDCKMIRLYPRPDPEELRRFYPSQHQTGDDAPGFWTKLLRRFLYRDQVRFVRTALDEVPGDGPLLDVGCGAMPSAPFPSGTFAAITMFGVLEHLYDPSVYVEAAAQLLRPGGRLIVQVPNAASWQFLLLGERWSGLDIPRHLLLFRSEDLENLLEFCGFEIVRRKRFSLRNDPLTLVNSFAPGLNPEVRRARATEENQIASVVKHILFGLLWLLALPIAALESSCRGGATLTVEARLKGASSDYSI
jgi:SAM-dependent methyltransferase